MNILIAHNFYQQPGGEDQVFRSELELLESYGHRPQRFEMHNDAVDSMGKLALLGATVWNRSSAAQLREVIREKQIEVVHFHNTFPLMSPAAYYAAREEGAAVVQTLHNFRFLCAGANLFRDGKVCEDCVGKVPWRGVVHGCYRGSCGATAAVAAMLTTHRVIGTYRSAVDVYVALTEFAKRKFIEGGLPGEKIVVKPNFVHPAPGVGTGGGGYAIFVARLSEEKGLDTLLAAWDVLGDSVPLKIVGDGPLAEKVKAAAAKNATIQWLGRKDSAEVYELIGSAELLIQPSQCYETFGRVAIEAFAKGTPVVASNHGAMADVVTHGKTGLLFTPGDGRDLAAKVRYLLADNALRAKMRENARLEFETKYTGDRNYEQLMSVYSRALSAAAPRRASAAVAAVGQ